MDARERTRSKFEGLFRNFNGLTEKNDGRSVLGLGFERGTSKTRNTRQSGWDRTLKTHREFVTD